VLSLMILISVPLLIPAAERGQRIVDATYKLTDGQTAATCFLIERPQTDGKGAQIVLVTAAHVLENFKGEEARLIQRLPVAEDRVELVPWPFRIRQGNQPLWKKHPQTDVAAMVIQPANDPRPNALPDSILATAETWQQHEFEPGDIVRLVGYPHALQFEPSPQGYATTRLGALSGRPSKPTERSRQFLIGVNVFEGDSGGPVYYLGDKPPDGGPRPLVILGLVQGQHFLNESFRTAYQSAEFRQRLGVGIVSHATAITETLAQIPLE
jgi:hypothetical protein